METNVRPPLPLELFATLTARLEAGAPRDQVLASESVDLERWERTKEYWLERMSREAANERFGTALQYGEAFKAEQERVGDGGRGARREPRAIRRGRIADWRGAASAAPAPLAAGDGVAGNAAAAGAAPLAAHTARLNLEQLAAMRAELATTTEPEHAATRERFGLDAASWAREEAHWQERLRADPKLFKTYVSRFQYFRALLQRR